MAHGAAKSYKARFRNCEIHAEDLDQVIEFKVTATVRDHLSVYKELASTWRDGSALKQFTEELGDLLQTEFERFLNDRRAKEADGAFLADQFAELANVAGLPQSEPSHECLVCRGSGIQVYDNGEMVLCYCAQGGRNE